MNDAQRPELSVVVPAHDEEGNVALLVSSLVEALAAIDHEIVLVDDASRDRTRAEMLAASARHPRVRVIGRRTRSGKSGALWSGFRHARGRAIATIDADLQNDPADVARCHAALVAGVDAVNGRRDRTRDSRVRWLSSRIGNGVRRTLLGGSVDDAGTGIRVFRREWLEALVPFEGMHRYFAEMVERHGARVIEVPITQRPRHWGVAKYGVGNRALRGLVDVLAMRWLLARSIPPGDEELRPEGELP